MADMLYQDQIKGEAASTIVSDMKMMLNHTARLFRRSGLTDYLKDVATIFTMPSSL